MDHEEHARRASSFGSQAAAYAEHRPDYPADLLAWALEPLRGTGRLRVLDIGAGTGKLTGGLLGQGVDVVAVEPDPAMLAELTSRFPDVDAMPGNAEEIPLPDLLQLLSTSRKSGVLTVNNGVSIGKIYLRKGALYFATINDDFAVSPQKSIYRMLTWATGTFELEPSVELQVMEEVQESTEALLMEGVRQLDEFRNRQKQLPPLGSPLAVPTPLAGKLRDLSPQELDIFQLVLDHGQVQAVLDNYYGTDLDAAQQLIGLMQREFIVVP